MKMTIEATDESVELADGGEGQVWRGLTEGGVRVMVIVSRIGCHVDDQAAFELELSSNGEALEAAATPTIN